MELLISWHLGMAHGKNMISYTCTKLQRLGLKMYNVQWIQAFITENIIQSLKINKHK